MRENRLYMPLLWQFPEYCEQFRLYRLQVVQANGSRQGTPLYNRPCIIGACASPNKNRLHTERQPEMSMLKFWIYGGMFALFRLQFYGMWVIMDISIFMPVWACKRVTSVYILWQGLTACGTVQGIRAKCVKMAFMNKLWNRAKIKGKFWENPISVFRVENPYIWGIKKI